LDCELLMKAPPEEDVQVIACLVFAFIVFAFTFIGTIILLALAVCLCSREREARASQQAAREQRRPHWQQEVDGIAQGSRSWGVQVGRATACDLWTTLAVGLETEAAVQQFFAQRQPAQHTGGPTLKIKAAVKIVNDHALSTFASSRSLPSEGLRPSVPLDPLPAYARHGDTILFHGTSEASVANIQAHGRPSLRFAAHGMLGQGIYGAPDPRKSFQFCRPRSKLPCCLAPAGQGKFMFICRFNLAAAQRAGPSTAHKNSIFDEFAVYRDEHVVVLWMLEVRLA